MATRSESMNSEIAGLTAVLGPEVTKVLDPAVARAWLALLTAYGRVTRALSSELMDASGMSLADFDVLAQLARSEGHALRMSELADAVLISKSGLTRRIDRLAINGWVTRRRCTEDGRVHWATLTPLGLRTFKSVAPAHLAAVAERFGSALPAGELERFTRDLLKVAAKNAEPSQS
ncbi:MAG: MarR family transcriptional regulator [bacterium]|jgi:DNA-binding MarR family transcriptional regulator|nr:MarR family transcriptional regulator [Candidatus Aquidulcis sp.]